MVLDAGARYTENIQQIERATQQMTPDEIKRNPNAVFENVQETVGVMNERHDEKSRGIALMFVGYSAAFAAGLGIRIRKR